MSEWISKFFSNPLVLFIGFFGGVASIIAIPLAIYFYIKANKKRGLTYRVNEVRTPIVKSGQASKLTVLHNDTEVVGDITAVHIAIWNQGQESIRPKHMLRPLIIETENSVPILESNIRKMTRGVVVLRLDESQCEQGKLGVSWNIFEKNDGGIIQIIYAGSPDIRITAHAILEGQKNLISFAHLRHVQLYFKPQMVMSFMFLFLPLLLFLNSTTVPLWLRVMGVLLSIISFIAIFQTLSILRRQKPPFEF